MRCTTSILKKARRRFEELKQRFPDHPAAPYYLAANLFLRTLTKPSRLLPLLSNPSGSETFGENNQDKVDPDTAQQFRALTLEARLLAKARLKRNSRDTEALYFLGATDGLSAAFKSDGRRCALRRCIDNAKAASPKACRPLRLEVEFPGFRARAGATARNPNPASGIKLKV